MQLVRVIDKSHARRVVTTVFETMKAFDEHPVSLARANISYYSTHNLILFLRKISNFPLAITTIKLLFHQR